MLPGPRVYHKQSKEIIQQYVEFGIRSNRILSSPRLCLKIKMLLGWVLGFYVSIKFSLLGGGKELSKEWNIFARWGLANIS